VEFPDASTEKFLGLDIYPGDGKIHLICDIAAFALPHTIREKHANRMGHPGYPHSFVN
jgi:hypothetical protein